MTQAKDPNKTVALTLFDYNFITGKIVRKDGKELWTMLHHGYRWLRCDKRIVAYHRVAWLLLTGDWPEQDIDHVNRNKDCNSWINLRLATQKQNAENRGAHSNNLLGIRGVRYRPKDGFYQPRLMHKGQALYLGIYKDLDLAIAARKLAEEEIFTHAQ